MALYPKTSALALRLRSTQKPYLQLANSNFRLSYTPTALSYNNAFLAPSIVSLGSALGGMICPKPWNDQSALGCSWMAVVAQTGPLLDCNLGV